MKFLYEYRTPDNVRHADVISASSRDAAYATLRAKGIRPSRVEEAPGLANKLFGKGKRWLAIGFLLVVCGVLAGILLSTGDQPSPRAVYRLDNQTRRQVIGDMALVDKGVRTSWSFVFPEEGEQFLASFAMPGVIGKVKNVPEEEFRAALARQILPDEGDSMETLQIKSIVEGMKDEARRFLEKGGSVAQYGRLLVQRQQREIGYHQRVKTEMETALKNNTPRARIEQMLDERNADLRNMGIKTVILPEE